MLGANLIHMDDFFLRPHQRSRERLAIPGENIDHAMQSVANSLGMIADAFEKQLDNLYKDKALDIETDIAVMNSMLDREGLSDKKDFVVKEEPQGQVAAGGASR